MAAYRAYRKKIVPWAKVGLPVVGRAIRDAVLWLWHKLWRYEPYNAIAEKICKQGRGGDKVAIKFVAPVRHG